MAFRAFAIWLVLLVVAVLNGGFREAVLTPRLGAPAGHVVGSIMLSVGILLVTWVAVPWIRPLTARDALLVGMGWLALTLAFEFGFGRARGKAWGELLADYDLLHGRIWVLVLIATAAAPYVTARVRGLFGG